MSADKRQAIGAPGIAPTWCSSDKDFVTTALGSARLWATVGHGIVNEIYWPSTGQPQIRDLGFYLVNDRRWVDLKRVRQYRLATPGPDLPALTITHNGADYELQLELLPDPQRDVLLIRYAITGDYRLVVILAPHLGTTGHDNNAWIEDGSGYAQRGDAAVCLTADVPLEGLSCGYVGASDGWQDLNAHGRLTYDFEYADHGTVAITAQLAAMRGVLALGFADSSYGAHTLARTALGTSFEATRTEFLQAWHAWGTALTLPQPNATLGDAARLSAAVLKIHEDRQYPGAVVASLSVPWGNSTDSLGGYHLVWPRDAALTAFAFCAAHQHQDARNILANLMGAQQRDGHWAQNYFPSGAPFWAGVQLDEAAFPVLLAAKLRELGESELPDTVHMVRNAAGFISATGPSSPQDRWEENPGVSPFTLAIAIAALVAAEPWLTDEQRDYALDLADDWNERLENWCYVCDTELARRNGVDGYYVRLGDANKSSALAGSVLLRNRSGETIEASALVSMDFSWLVRLGLRHALDKRVTDTIAVVDATLKVDTPSGALYHRYNEDGYGEYPDGRPFDGSGVGRAWPLLVGERGHLVLQAGGDPLVELQTMWNCASIGGLLPEQVWDSDPIPALDLFPGRPSGSAMPLLWTHAEFLKLMVARELKRPVELLRAVERRYENASPPAARCWHWRSEVPLHHLPSGRGLLIEAREPFVLHLGWDGWQHVEDIEAVRQPLGLWGVRLDAERLLGVGELNFTRRYAHGWEGFDHRVELGQASHRHALQPAAPAPC